MLIQTIQTFSSFNYVFCLIFMMLIMTLVYIKQNRCCYSCVFDDDFTVLGCPICPLGYPCVYPCYGACLRKP